MQKLDITSLRSKRTLSRKSNLQLLRIIALHVVLVSVGSGGDILPFVNLGKHLTERGHQATLVTHCSYEQMATHAGLAFVPLDSLVEHQAFTDDQPLLNSPRGIPEFLKRHMLPNVPLHFEKIARQIVSQDTVLVTRDLFDTAPRFVCEKLGVPLIWVFTHPSQVSTWRLRGPLFADILGQELERIRSLIGLPPVSSRDYWLTYPNRSIALWPEWFAPVTNESPFNIVPAGFLPEDLSDPGEIPTAIRELLGGGEPPVLITAGTGAYLGREFYVASAYACALLNLPGIMVTQHKKQVPGDFPNCLTFVGYVPFRTLMPRMGGIIHHGGLGTLSCAMAAGIPQLVLPLGADRPDNATRLQKLGVAEVLPPPKWQPEKIAEALLRLMRSSTVASSCRALAEELKNNDAAVTACEVIEDYSKITSSDREAL